MEVNSSSSSTFRRFDFQGKNLSKSYLTGNDFKIVDSKLYTFASDFFLLHFRKYPSTIVLFLIVLWQTAFSEEKPESFIYSLLVLGVTLAYSAFKRLWFLRSISKKELEINNREVLAWENDQFVLKKRASLKLWDIVLLKDEQEFPADLVIIAKNPRYESCFLDEYKLTGIRDLQPKKPVKHIQELFSNASLENLGMLVSEVSGTIKVSNPDPNHEQFSGFYKAQKSPTSLKLTTKNFGGEGSVLKEGEWLIGIIVYAGAETKLRLNTRQPKLGVSSIEGFLKNYLFFLMGFLAVLATVMAAVGSAYKDNLQSVNFLIGHSMLVAPFSLPLVVTAVRDLHALKINRTSKAVQVINSDSLDYLGRAEYIHIEKPGLLESRKLIPKVAFIEDNQIPVQAFADSEFEPEMISMELQQLENYSTSNFMLALAMCNQHTYNPALKNIQSSTILDKAILETASKFQVRTHYQNPEVFTFCFNQEETDFYMAAHQRFSLEDCKFRIVVKNLTTKQVTLFIRGDQKSITPLLSLHFKVKLQETLRSCQSTGQEQVVFGSKILSQQEYQNFKYMYKSAQRSPVNRIGRIKGVFEKFEKDLNLLGFLSFEDNVEEKANSASQALTEAGLKFWLFSNDKEEKLSASRNQLGLFKDYENLVPLKEINNKFELYKKLERAIDNQIVYSKEEVSVLRNNLPGSRYLTEIVSPKINPLSNVRRSDSNLNDTPSYIYPRLCDFSNQEVRPEGSKNYSKSIVPLMMKIKNLKSQLSDTIGNENLKNCIGDFGINIENSVVKIGCKSKKCSKVLYEFLISGSFVNFYAIKPFSIKLVSEIFTGNLTRNHITLSVGSTYSWNGLMKNSNVSIEITDHLSDTRVFTDIKVKKYKDLKELVLCYGHWFLNNISKIIYLDAYKNALIITVVMFFQFYSNFSGGFLFSNWDLFFCCQLLLVPVFGVEGVFAQDLTKEKLCQSPKIHKSAIDKSPLNITSLLYYFFLGVLHGCILCLFELTFASTIVNSSGLTENQELIKAELLISVVLTLQSTCLLQSSCINILTVLSHVVSLVAFILVLTLKSQGILTQEKVGVFEFIQTSTFSIVLCPCLCFVLTYFLKIVLFQKSLENLSSRVYKLRQKYYPRIETYTIKFRNNYEVLKKKSKKNKYGKFDLNQYTLRFRSKLTEKDFRKEISSLMIKKYRVILFSTFIFTLAISLLGTIVFPFSLVRTLGLNLICIFFFCMTIFSLTKTFLTNTSRIGVLINVFLQVIQLFLVLFTTTQRVEVPMVLSILFYLALDMEWLPTFITNLSRLLILLAYVLEYFQQTYEGEDRTLQTILFIIKLLGIEVTSAIMHYDIDKQKRKDFQLRQELDEEIKKTNSVLTYILPEFVRKRVKEGVRYIAEDRGTVSILFCNINEFDRIVATYSPQELTKFLDKTFRKFDELCEKVGMTKVETVGYTYMACAGLTDSENELNSKLANVSHARRAVEMAIGIKNECQNVFLMDGSELEVKIGIHSGEVAAGVVGSHKPQFSLVGDTVNTASRMATTAINSIQISKATYDLLEDTQGLNFKPLIVFVKGKGDMQTYELELNTHRSTLVDLSSKKKINIASFDSIQPFGSEINSYTSKKTTRVKEQEPRLNTEVETRSIRMCSLSLKETPYEKQFRLLTIFRKKKSIYFALVIYLVCCFGDLFVMLLCMAIDGQNIAGLFVIQICKMSFVVVLLLLKKKYYEKYWFGWVLQGGYFLIYLMMLLEIRLSTWYSIEVWNSSIFYDLLIFCQCSQLFFKHVIMSAVLAAVLYMGELALMGFFETLAFSSVFLSIYLSVIITSLYYREKLLHVHTLRNQEVQREKQKTESLLMKMMPPHAYTNLREENNFVDTLYDVTLMYADIVGFTQWSSGKEPIQVVEMLSKLFDRFDKVCEEFGVYKVHTIGDCYVVMGNLSNRDRNPSKECLNMVMFAQRIIESIKEVNANYGMELGMRIGMNTGEVIGGIAGTNIVRYDIYGADVLVANKVESNGISGAICISEKSKNYLEMAYPNQLSFEFHKKVPIPSIYQEVNIYIAKFS